MDTSRWKAGDEFQILDLVASFAFKSASSLSFELGTRGDSLMLPGMIEPCATMPGRVFTVIGWLDVHHPCQGHIKAQVRVCLPDRYHEWQRMGELVREVFEHLGILPDETYEAHFVASSRQTRIEQARDRHGMVNRLY